MEQALGQLLRRRLHEPRTVMIPSMDALEAPAMLHSCVIGAQAWIVACVARGGELSAAVETAGFDPTTGELALSILRGAAHQLDLVVEVVRDRREALPVTRCGRRLMVSGLSAGQEYRVRLAWPGGASLPLFLSVAARRQLLLCGAHA